MRQRIWRQFALFTILLLYPPLANASGEVETTGTISALSSSSVTVDAVLYSLSPSTVYKGLNGETVTFAAFSNGDRAEAEGTFQSGVLVASRLSLEDDIGVSEVEAEGIVSAKTPSSVTVQNTTFTVDGSTAILGSDNETISFDAIVAGSSINVKASTGAPTTATRIKLRSGVADNLDSFSGSQNDVESIGLVSAASASSLTVNSVVYVINAATRFEAANKRPSTVSSIQVGDLVKIEFYSADSTNIARRIERQDAVSGAVEVTGPIGELSASSITIRGITAALTGETVYRTRLNETASLADLTVGVPANLEATRQGDGSLVANEVKIRNRVAKGDFDDDGLMEKVVYRPELGNWYINYNSDANNDGLVDTEARQWGLPGDVPVLLNTDGDRKSEIAVFRPSNATWYILQSTTGYVLSRTVQWGLPGDIPVPADYDGDGKTDIAVWRPTTGTWYVILSSGTGRAGALLGNPGDQLTRQWGLSSHQPIGGMDVDGDDRADLVVWDSTTGIWYVLYSSSGYNRDAALQQNTSAGAITQWGVSGDVPQKGDFDGDGRDDLTVWRYGLWFIKYSTGTAPVAVQWGLPGDIPGVTYLSDSSVERRSSLVVFRPAEGSHYERSPAGSETVTQWGLSGDIPVGYSDDGVVHN